MTNQFPTFAETQAQPTQPLVPQPSSEKPARARKTKAAAAKPSKPKKARKAAADVLAAATPAAVPLKKPRKPRAQKAAAKNNTGISLMLDACTSLKAADVPAFRGLYEEVLNSPKASRSRIVAALGKIFGG